MSWASRFNGGTLVYLAVRKVHENSDAGDVNVNGSNVSGWAIT